MSEEIGQLKLCEKISKLQKTLNKIITGDVTIDFYVLSPIMKDRIATNEMAECLSQWRVTLLTLCA